MKLVLASESHVILAGLYAMLRSDGVKVSALVRDPHAVLASVTAPASTTVVVAPVTRLSEGLDTVLVEQLARIRTILLLPPTAVQLYATTIGANAMMRILSLTASAEEILGAIRDPVDPVPAAISRRSLVAGVGGQLTSREQEVLDQLALGCSNGQIAARMLLCEDTVKSHLTRVYRKLGVRSRGEAITTYLEAA